MTLNIAVGLSFYNDFDSLRRMLTSIQAYPIDLIIAVDGKYKGHPAELQFSEMECREIFGAFQTHYSLVAISNRTEIEKRQLYFDHSGHENIDVLLVMDSDEYFIQDKTNWPLFIQDLEQKIEANKGTYRQSYSVPVQLKNKGELSMPSDYIENLPRLFHRPGELQYVDDHYTIRNRSTGVLMSYQSDTLCQHILLGHDHDLRTKEYQEQRLEYQKRLIAEENAKRKERQDDFVKSIQS